MSCAHGLALGRFELALGNGIWIAHSAALSDSRRCAAKSAQTLSVGVSDRKLQLYWGLSEHSL